MKRWTWACGSQVGTSHMRTGQRLQDAYSCFTVRLNDQEVFAAVVSDGAGSAEFGGEGASLVCRTMGTAIRAHLSESIELPPESLLERWIDSTRDRIYRVAERRGKEPRDFAATLVCAISDGERSVYAHIGDGCAVVRDRSGHWLAPTWPDHGEYASMTSFVTEQPAPKLRVTESDAPLDIVCVFSDGIERMVLNEAARQPFDGFFRGISAPVSASPITSGKDPDLSAKLRSYLASEAVVSRTDDDKTLVIAVLR